MQAQKDLSDIGKKDKIQNLKSEISKKEDVKKQLQLG